MLFYHIIRTICVLFVCYEGVRKVACVCACLGAWGDQNLTLGCLLELLLHFVFFLGGTGSLTEPGAHRLARLADPGALGSDLFLPLGFCGCWWSNSDACACPEGVLSTEQAPQSNVESFQTEAGGRTWLIACSHMKDRGLSHQHYWGRGC